MANQWFRLYSEFAFDPKVQMLSESDQRRLVMLFCLRCSNADETLHDKHVTFQLRISNEEWAVSKGVFIENGFIDSDNNILNWDRRQYQSDSSAARVSRHREKVRNATVTPVTTCNVTVTPPEQIQNRTDIPAKTNVLPISPKPEKKERKTSIPDGFCVTEELRRWAEEKGINNLDSHVEPFIATCKANGYKYANWHFAFQRAVNDDWAKIGHGKQQQRRFVPA